MLTVFVFYTALISYLRATLVMYSLMPCFAEMTIIDGTYGDSLYRHSHTIEMT